MKNSIINMKMSMWLQELLVWGCTARVLQGNGALGDVPSFFQQWSLAAAPINAPMLPTRAAYCIAFNDQP